MATKKATTTKKAPVKSAASKTTVRTISADASKKPAARNVAKVSATESSDVVRKTSSPLPANLVNIVMAELVGTFILTMVALLAVKETGSLYVGLALTLLVLAIGAVSGAHVNPAVTFGLWAVRKIRAALVPFYWIAQLLGAMLAVVVMNVTTGQKYALDMFSNFGTWSWSIFAVEMLGMAVFMFGLNAALSRRDFSVVGRAFGVGLSLMIGVVVASSLFATVQSAIDTSKITDVKDVPHELRVKGPALNPAVALAASEQSDSALTGGRGSSEDKQFSRFSAEVIVGTFAGALIGGYLYNIVAGARRND